MSVAFKEPGLTPNRAIMLYHLRVNPGNAKQITGALKDAVTGDMCAVGLACDAFKIPMTVWELSASGKNPNSFNAYSILADKLEIPENAVRQLYGLNDINKLSFTQVAKVAERYFLDETGAQVRDIYKQLQAEGELS